MTTGRACCATPPGWPRPRPSSAKVAGVSRDEVGTRVVGDHQPGHISTGLADAAALREETRGSHWREDFPERDDDRRSPATSTSSLRDGEIEAGLRPESLHDGDRDAGRTRCRRRAGAAGLDPAEVQAASTGRSPRTCPTAGRHQRGHDPGRGAAARVFRGPGGRHRRRARRSRPWSSRPSWATRSRSRTGSPTAPGSRPATWSLRVAGPTRGLLTAERTALNFACHLSGVATATAAWVDALEGTSARVLDTRKTLPGWRALQKYAVRCGGGVNHRMSLSDRAMVKDNHVVAAGGVVPAYDAVRARLPGPARRGRGRPTSTSSASCSTPAATEILLDNMSHRGDGRGGRDHRRPRHAGGLGRADLRAGPARSPRPASTSSRSAR